MRDKVEQLQADIEQGVAELVDGEDWTRWLRVAAKFPRYSFRNTLLILMQRPDATAVMGYRAWQALGHQVRKGESSIKILAPCTYKTKRSDDEDHDDEQPGRKVLRGFRLAHVFDISSTDGDTVRPPAGPTLLEGEAPAGLWDTLAAQVQAQGFRLERAEIPSGANGTTNFATRTVTVADDLSPAQACKTLAHDPLTAPVPSPGRCGGPVPLVRFQRTGGEAWKAEMWAPWPWRGQGDSILRRR